MSRAAVKAKQKDKAATRIDRWQTRIEAEAFLDILIVRCEGCRSLVVTKRDTPCICGCEIGTFDSFPTIPLAE